MGSQIFSSSNYVRTKHTIPGKSDFVVEFLGTYANYFRVLNLGTSPLYFGTISTPSSALFDFKVNAGSLGHFCEPFERDRLYVYNPSTEPTDIILTRWKDEFDGSFASMNNLSIAIDGEVRTDGIIKGFESALPSGSNNIGKVSLNEEQFLQFANKATEAKQIDIFNKLNSINTSLDYISEHMTGEKAVKTVKKIVQPVSFWGNDEGNYHLLFLGYDFKKLLYFPYEIISELSDYNYTFYLYTYKNNQTEKYNLSNTVNQKFFEISEIDCDLAYIKLPANISSTDKAKIKAIAEIQDDSDLVEEEITLTEFDNYSLVLKIDELSQLSGLNVKDILGVTLYGIDPVTPTDISLRYEFLDDTDISSQNFNPGEYTTFKITATKMLRPDSVTIEAYDPMTNLSKVVVKVKVRK